MKPQIPKTLAETLVGTLHKPLQNPYKNFVRTLINPLSSRVGTITSPYTPLKTTPKVLLQPFLGFAPAPKP